MSAQAQAETTTQATQDSTSVEAQALDAVDVTTKTAPENGENAEADMATLIEKALANGENTQEVVARFSRRANPTKDGADAESTEEDEATETNKSGAHADAEGNEGDETDEQDDDGDSTKISKQEDDEDALPERYRWKNDLDKKVSALRKAGLSWSEAETKAKEQLGLLDPESDSTQDDESDEIPSLSELQDRRKAIKAEKLQALKDYDNDKVADLEEQLDELEEQAIPEATARERQAQETASQQFDEQWEGAWSEALALYPEAGDADSALYARMQEIDARLQQADPELFAMAGKPLVLARMAAREEGIAPAPKGAKPPVTRKVTSSKAPEQQSKIAPRRSATVNPIASGGARRTPQSTATEALVDELKNADVTTMSEEDYQALRAKAGFRVDA